MKKELTKEESMAIARRLGITSYFDIDSLIKSLHIENKKEIDICVVTTDRTSAEFVFRALTGLTLQVNFDNIFKAEIRYGKPSHIVMTEYGELTIDYSQLIECVTKTDTYCKVTADNDVLRNLTLTLVYASEYTIIDIDSWRLTLLEADKLILFLNAHQILNASEHKFISSQLQPMFSPQRLIFGIGNAQYLKADEWLSAISRIHRMIGPDYKVFPFFTEDLPEEIRQSYPGHEVTVKTFLNQTSHDVVATRRLHIEDLNKFESNVLETALHSMLIKNEQFRSKSSESFDIAELDINMLKSSRSHISGYIELFLKTPLLAHYRNDVEKFASLLVKSLTEDIMESSDIKQDAKSLPRYMSEIWNLFSKDQNTRLLKIFEEETSIIMDMMKLDLKKIANTIHDTEIKTDLEQQIEGSFCVHTFFARKTTSGNGFTEALTIGGIIATVLAQPIGIAAIITSELIKVFGKKGFDKEFKEELVIKINDVVDRNKTELIMQSNLGFQKVADEYRKEILKYYDDIISELNDIISKENMKIQQATDTINFIRTLI